MPTIVVDPEDRGVMTGTQLPPPADFKPKPIRERIGEPLGEEAECCLLDGKPYLLYPNWDYAENWSGEFIREVHPFSLVGAPKISSAEFWRLVVLCSEKPIQVASEKALKYSVYVSDNFHYMDESEKYLHGSYASFDDAVVVSKGIVDLCLADYLKPGLTAEQVFDQYVAFGEDPHISGPKVEGVSFSAWTYAKSRCEEQCRSAAESKKPPISDETLVQARETLVEKRYGKESGLLSLLLFIGALMLPLSILEMLFEGLVPDALIGGAVGAAATYFGWRKMQNNKLLDQQLAAVVLEQRRRSAGRQSANQT